MCFMRDQMTNRNINHNDDKLKSLQKEKRESTHNKVQSEISEFEMGDDVMVKDCRV